MALRSAAVAPDLVLALLLSGCLAVTVAVTAREFTPWLVGPLFLVFVALFTRFLPAPPAADRSHAAAGAASIAGAAIWAVLNLPYVAQLLWITRDPGIYTALGIWLGHHRTIDIDGRGLLQIAQQFPEVSTGINPFGLDSSGVGHGQGGVTVPGLLGVGTWVGGVPGALQTNIWVGAVALVATYALGRRLVGPWLALVAEGALGLAVAFVYLMRAPYSEGVMLVAVAAGLIWFLAALREGRAPLAAVGGVFIGIASMARVDGVLALVGVCSLVAVLGLVARADGVATLRRIGVTFLGSSLAWSLVGLLTVYLDQRGYVESLRGQVILIWTAALGALGAALLILMLRRVPRPLDAPRELGDRLLKRVGVITGLAVPVVFGVWWSRPAWWHGHFIAAGSPYALTIETLQRQTGQPIDGTRSYDELTLHWVGWYFGWATVVLAAIGLGLAAYRGIARRDVGALTLLVPTAVAALLYFNKVSVTPDQVWAYRRLLPVITPGLLVGALIAVDWWLGLRLRTYLRVGVAATAGALVLAGPLVSWSALVRVPDGDGALHITQSLCDRIHGPVLVAAGHAPANIEGTIKTVCGQDPITASVASGDLLKRLAAKIDGLQVVAFSPEDLPRSAVLGAPNIAGTHRYWAHTLVDVPDTYDTVTWKIWVGRVEGGRFIQEPRGHE